HQPRMAVTQGVDRDAAGEVHQFSTALIPDSRAQAAHRNEGRGGVVGNHKLIEIGALNRRGLSGHRSISCHVWPTEREWKHVLDGPNGPGSAVYTLWQRGKACRGIFLG